MSRIRVRTVDGFSVPGLPTEPSCLGAVGIDAETGTDIGDVPCLSVLIIAIGVWSTATRGATASGKLLESMDLNNASLTTGFSHSPGSCIRRCDIVMIAWIHVDRQGCTRA